MGKVSQNDGQCFSKQWATFFEETVVIRNKKEPQGKSLELFMSQSDRKPEITQRSQRPEPQPQRLLQLPQPS